MRYHYSEMRRASKSITSRRCGNPPNGTIRAMLDGTVFRTPILVKALRHSSPPGQNRSPSPVMLTATYTQCRDASASRRKGRACCHGCGGKGARVPSMISSTPGIIQGIHNLDKSIGSFARSCFNYALDTKRTSGLQRMIPFPSSTITGSRIFSKRSLTLNIRKNSMQQGSSISIP